MQKKHAKGFFLDSSYRKGRALKSLLHRRSDGKDDEKETGDIYQGPKNRDFSNGVKDASDEDPHRRLKRAARI
ncbi:MAG: hypothetical protein A2W01_02920 [Candidatus Solincola sediminis]|uniref:Uncharacterized protein n=1 Tax=Candidatus Solincola sediminis TaxID=1797199 RepID=A0A1F2WM67_9ACTN|nr:MAG: hypothetical protein A2Y75_11705 [Candidatus Solincola sediminis]OFW58363.1 MAG: hypothetical protein A2W01_02920 [Candidatus Solincola sediminis]